MLNLCSFYGWLGLGRVKIILHRIISVVWLTNFPSEIRRLTSPRWWAVPLFPEREKARGPAISWEPCIDDRLSLPRASTKEKMPAEWLLYFKMGSLKILLNEWISTTCLLFNPRGCELLRVNSSYSIYLGVEDFTFLFENTFKYQTVKEAKFWINHDLSFYECILPRTHLNCNQS